MVLTIIIAKRMVKELTKALEKKEEDIEEQNKLNLKFSQMIEEQNKKLGKELF